MGFDRPKRKDVDLDMLEGGDASDSCDDEDALSCRTDLTTVKARTITMRRVTVRSAKKNWSFVFVFQRGERIHGDVIPRKKIHENFPHLSHTIFSDHTSSWFYLIRLNLLILSSRSLSLSLSSHLVWPRIQTLLAKVSLLDDSVTWRH
jgi:hypothetical protein